MDKNQQNRLARQWYAEIYEQQETQTDDVEFMLKRIGPAPQRILEACCGGGRILVPLARAGHAAHGFDADPFMLERIRPRAEGLPNIRWWQMDALEGGWGSGYDAVILGGNLLINIETGMDYAQAQRLFLCRAAESAKPGGHVLLDFDLRAHPEQVFNFTGERVIFEGLDSRGTYGRFIVCSSVYDKKSQIVTGSRRTGIKTAEGDAFTIGQTMRKHIPTLAQVAQWLDFAGLRIEKAYFNYADLPFGEDTCRATLWIERPEG